MLKYLKNPPPDFYPGVVLGAGVTMVVMLILLPPNPPVVDLPKLTLSDEVELIQGRLDEAIRVCGEPCEDLGASEPP